MKIFFLFIIIVWFLFLGWFSMTRQTKQISPNQSIPNRSLSSTTQWTWVIADLKVRQKEFEKFSEFLLEIEKKYQTGNSFPNMSSYISYLEEAIKYSYQNPAIYSVMRYPYVDMKENIKYMKNALSEGKGVNYGPVAQIIESVHWTFPNSQKSPQTECAKDLMKVEDLWKYFNDLSMLSYSKYKNARLFNMLISDKKLSDMYNPKGLEWKIDNEMPLRVRLNRLIIWDMLFFHWLESVTLKGISDGLVCRSDKPWQAEWCLNLKKALLEWDREFIRKKFESNPRKYDLDSFFILYLIGDLDKQAFVNKICLIN